MPLSHSAEAPPDVSVQQRSSDELTKLVGKLRWMGLELEAERTQCMLSRAVRAGAATNETD